MYYILFEKIIYHNLTKDIINIQYMSRDHFYMLNHLLIIKFFTEKGWKTLAKEGNLDAIKVLINNNVNGYSYHVFDIFAEHGNIEALKWLYNNGYKQFSHNAIDNAAKNGHLNVMKWISHNLYFWYSQHVLWNAAISGNCEIIKWLLNKNVKCDKITMRKSLEYGCLGVAKYLYETKSITPSWEDVYLVRRKGNKELFNWIKFNKRRFFNIDELNKFDFNWDSY